MNGSESFCISARRCSLNGDECGSPLLLQTRQKSKRGQESVKEMSGRFVLNICTEDSGGTSVFLSLFLCVPAFRLVPVFLCWVKSSREALYSADAVGQKPFLKSHSKFPLGRGRPGQMHFGNAIVHL